MAARKYALVATSQLPNPFPIAIERYQSIFADLQDAAKFRGFNRRRRAASLHNHEDPASAGLGEIQRRCKQEFRQTRIADCMRPLPVALGDFRQPPAAFQKVELLRALGPYLDLAVRCEHAAEMASAEGSQRV